MTQSVETLIHGRWVVAVEPDCEPRADHSIAIEAGKIVAVLPTDDAKQRFAAQHTVVLSDHLLIPGLVNAHTHAAMTLFRGLADDLPLKNWLYEHIWPAETRWVDSEFTRIGTQLAIIEMLHGGTTCFNDMYFFPDVVADTCQSAGMRACVGLIVLDFPTAWARDADDYLHKGTEVHDEYRDSELISTAFAPHAPYSVSDKPLRKLKVLADELGIPIHIHLHETAHEIEESLQQHKVRPLERLSQLGLLNDRLLAVHATQLLDAEIDALARHGATVVHCPESNLKLASGFCRAADLAAAGVNLALGTDGAASNNDLDMLGELRSAALLAKGVSGDPTALPAPEVLRMATLNGARALGLDAQLGSLLPGKRADIVAVDLSAPASQPVYDPLVQLVYSAVRDQVTDVWINGRRVLHDRACSVLDYDVVRAQAQDWAQRIGDERADRMTAN